MTYVRCALIRIGSFYLRQTLAECGTVQLWRAYRSWSNYQAQRALGEVPSVFAIVL